MATQRPLMCFKGQVHPEVKKPHLHADGKSEEVFVVHKTLMELQRKTKSHHSPEQLK